MVSFPTVLSDFPQVLLYTNFNAEVMLHVATVGKIGGLYILK